MKWIKILGFALLNAFGFILYFAMLFAFILPIHGTLLTLMIFGVPVVAVIGMSIIESRMSHLPLWGVLIATIVLMLATVVFFMFLIAPGPGGLK